MIFSFPSYNLISINLGPNKIEIAVVRLLETLCITTVNVFFFYFPVEPNIISILN